LEDRADFGSEFVEGSGGKRFGSPARDFSMTNCAAKIELIENARKIGVRNSIGKLAFDARIPVTSPRKV